MVDREGHFVASLLRTSSNYSKDVPSFHVSIPLSLSHDFSLDHDLPSLQTKEVSSFQFSLYENKRHHLHAPSVYVANHWYDQRNKNHPAAREYIQRTWLAMRSAAARRMVGREGLEPPKA